MKLIRLITSKVQNTQLQIVWPMLLVLVNTNHHQLLRLTSLTLSFIFCFGGIMKYRAEIERKKSWAISHQWVVDGWNVLMKFFHNIYWLVPEVSDEENEDELLNWKMHDSHSFDATFHLFYSRRQLPSLPRKFLYSSTHSTSRARDQRGLARVKW